MFLKLWKEKKTFWSNLTCSACAALRVSEHRHGCLVRRAVWPRVFLSNRGPVLGSGGLCKSSQGSGKSEKLSTYGLLPVLEQRREKTSDKNMDGSNPAGSHRRHWITRIVLLQPVLDMCNMVFHFNVCKWISIYKEMLCFFTWIVDLYAWVGKSHWRYAQYLNATTNWNWCVFSFKLQGTAGCKRLHKI